MTRLSIRLFQFAFFVLACIFSFTAHAADSWPEWRGPNHQGNSSATNIPIEWSESKNVAWRTPIKGRGWSTPVIANGRIWVTTAIDKPASVEDAERRRKAASNPQPVDDFRFSHSASNRTRSRYGTPASRHRGSFSRTAADDSRRQFVCDAIADHRR